MTDDPNLDSAVPARPRHPRRRVLVSAAVIVGVALAVVAVMVVLFVQDATRPLPSFPSLADRPDTSLHGTVAYFSDTDGCVRLIAASGAGNRRLVCLPASQDVGAAKKLGKLIGPQLLWRDDGRLEVTMFRMQGGGSEPVSFHPGWQQLVDPTTEMTTDVPASELRADPTPMPNHTTNRAGQRLRVTGSGGSFAITLEDSSGSTRTLVQLDGPRDGYQVQSVSWSPDERWIVVDDGRILVVTPKAPARTRLLTTDTRMVAFDEGARFAVTGADLLNSA